MDFVLHELVRTLEKLRREITTDVVPSPTSWSCRSAARRAPGVWYERQPVSCVALQISKALRSLPQSMDSLAVVPNEQRMEGVEGGHTRKLTRACSRRRATRKVAPPCLGRRVLDLEHLEDGGTVVRDGHVSDGVDQHLVKADRAETDLT